MKAIPDTYFSRRMRESHIAMSAATDSCSRLAHSQLEAAYRVLAGVAEPLPPTPRFQYGQPADAPAGLAPETLAAGIAA